MPTAGHFNFGGSLRGAWREWAAAVGAAWVLGSVVAAMPTTPSAAAALTEVRTSEKVCQLTGEVDWDSGKPTPAKTRSNFGLDAVDLGYPVDDGKTLFLLFGDTWPPPGKETPIGPPNDAVGSTTRTAPPSASDGCLDLKINDQAGRRKYAAATIVGPLPVMQGDFNVPSGGVSIGGDIFAFFWTDHCGFPNHLDPSSAAPLARPARSPGCPETDTRNSVGSAALASSTDGGRTFSHVVSMPPGFVYSIAVNTKLEQGVPVDQQLGVYIFGVPRFRASAPFLAYAPVATLSSPATWHFFAGMSADGTPNWITEDAWGKNATPNWKPTVGAEITQPDDAERCIGEFSVTWNGPLNAWLMLYNCNGDVEARIAPAPWGPWSPPVTILKEDDKVACRLIMAPTGCAGQRDYWPNNHVNGQFDAGRFYAPFVLNRYTSSSGNGSDRVATIYWLVSAHNPYEVTVMRSTLQAASN